MKNLLIIIACISLLFTGCAVTTTTPKLQNADQVSAVNNNTVKITKDESAGDFAIRINVTKNRDSKLSTRVKEHTLVNENGIYVIEPVDQEVYFIERAGVNTMVFTGNNFHWNLPNLQTNIEMEVNVTSNFSVYGGTTFTDVYGVNLHNFNIGLGFFREQNDWAIRFDLAGVFYETQTDLDYVRVEDKPFGGDATRKVFIFSETKKENFFDLNLGLTINSSNPDWFANGFINYTFGHQNFMDSEPTPVTFFDWLESSYDKRFEYDENYHSLSLGLYKDFESLGKLIGGVRFVKYTDTRDNLFIPNYFLQFDFDLF